MFVRLLLLCIYYTIGGFDNMEINLQGNKGALFQKNEKATDWRGGGNNIQIQV